MNLIIIRTSLLVLCCITSLTQAQIITDGTLGRAPHSIAGINDVSSGATVYSISEQFGHRQGDNLFHSFQQFDLSNNEVADAAGGNIRIVAGQHILITDQAQITTSVLGSTGDGGNIEIAQPTFVILDDGRIIAQAVAGDGGDITIDTQFLLASSASDTQIDASSQLGIDGDIVITSPIIDASAEFVVLPSNFLHAATLLRE